MGKVNEREALTSRSSLLARATACPAGLAYYFEDGDGCALGEPLTVAPLGDAIDGLFVVVGTTVRAPNQFHWVKPKNRSINTSKARIAAATPAPAPALVSLVSTTSEPAGLQ